MDARDVIAEANKWRYKQAWDGGGREYALRDADAILAALAADGYVIVRREQVGWAQDERENTASDMSFGWVLTDRKNASGWARPVYVDVIEEDA